MSSRTEKFIVSAAVLGVLLVLILGKPPSRGADERLALLLGMRGDSVRGERLFEEHCGACHDAHSGSGRTAVDPGLYAYADTVKKRLPGVDLRRHTLLSILDPDRYIRPGFEGGRMSWYIPGRLTDDEIVDIAEYVLTL